MSSKKFVIINGRKYYINYRYKIKPRDFDVKKWLINTAKRYISDFDENLFNKSLGRKKLSVEKFSDFIEKHYIKEYKNTLIHTIISDRRLDSIVSDLRNSKFSVRNMEKSSTEYIFYIKEHFEWPKTLFGDKHACFHSYNIGRPIEHEHLGAVYVVMYRKTKDNKYFMPAGRMFVYPDNTLLSCGFITFNSYSNCGLNTNMMYMFSNENSVILPYYTKNSLVSVGIRGSLYINSNVGWLTNELNTLDKGVTSDSISVDGKFVKITYSLTNEDGKYNAVKCKKCNGYYVKCLEDIHDCKNYNHDHNIDKFYFKHGNDGRRI